MKLATIILCVLIADFITGLVHWWEDTYGLPTWPVLGPAVIKDNIDHHLHPSEIGSMGGIVYRNYQTWLLASVLVLVLHLLDVAYWPFVLTACVASFGNEIHTWTHRKSPSKLVRLLQDCDLIHTPQQHAKHHKPPYDTYFCTITNVVNPLLEVIDFWRRVEWLIANLFGVEPKRMTAARNYV